MPKVTSGYKEERRAFILEGALRLFAEKGYEAATIHDLAQYLNISKGAIYTYFSGKEEIYIRLMEDRTRRTLDEIRRRFSSIPDAEGKLRTLIGHLRDTSLDFLWTFGRVHYEFWLYSSRREELLRLMEERYQLAVSLVEEVVEEGKRGGEFRPETDARVVGRLFWAIRDGIGLHFSVTGGEREHARLWKEAEEMIFRHLKA